MILAYKQSNMLKLQLVNKKSALSPFYILIYMLKELMHGYVKGLSCKLNIYVPWFTYELRVRLAPWNHILPTVPRRYFFCWSFVLFMSCVYHAFASVHCNLVVTCWKRVDLLALVCGVYLCFCHFPMWYPGSDVVFDCIVSWFMQSFLLCGPSLDVAPIMFWGCVGSWRFVFILRVFWFHACLA